MRVASLTVFDSPDEIGADVERLDKRQRFCEFLRCGFEGREVAFAAEQVGCPLARYNLGVGAGDDNQRSKLARMLVKWGDLAAIELATDYVDQLVQADLDGRWLVVRPGADADADLVVVSGTPAELMTLVGRFTRHTGQSVETRMGGVGASCGEIAARGLVLGEPVASLGCGGTRTHGGLPDSELLLGVTSDVYEMISKEK